MKKLLILILMFGLVSPLAFAAGQSGSDNGGLITSGAGAGNETADATGSGQGLMTSTETATQNHGEETQVQTQQQVQVRAGSYTTENGQQLQVQEQSNNQVRLMSGGSSAQTSMQMTQEQTQTGTQLRTQLSNGINAEIKVMPDTASETALARLRMHVCNESNNCTIQLKEVGSGEHVRAAYEMQVQKEVKVLGLFRAKMQVQAQIDAENGNVVQINQPWWAALSTDVEE